MLSARLASPVMSHRVRRELVRHNHVYVFAHVFLDVLRQCAGFNVLSFEEAQFAAALLNPKYGNLTFFPA